MIEFLFSLLLELILFLLVIFVIIVYLQRSIMESIWGDPLDATEEASSSLKSLDAFTGEVDRECYQENSDNTYDDEGLCLIDDNSNSLAFDKTAIGNKSSNLQNVENPSYDEKNLRFNEVNSESTASDDIYLSCGEDNPISTSPDIETTASDQTDLQDTALDNKDTSCSKDNSSTTPDYKELSYNNNLKNTNFDTEDLSCNKVNSKSTTEDEDLSNKVNAINTTAEINFDHAESLTSQPQNSDKDNKVNLKSRIDKAEILTDKAESEIDKAEIPIHKAESRIDKAESPIDKAESLIDKAESLIEKDESLNDKAKSPIDKAERLIDKAESLIDKDESLNDKAKSPIDKAESRIDKAESPIDKAESLIDKAESLIDKDESLNDKAKSTIDKAERLIDKAESPIDKAESLIDKAESLIDKDESLNDKAKSPIDKAERLIDEAESRIDKAESLIDNAESLIDKAESPIDKDESLIDKAESKSESEDLYKDNSKTTQIDTFDVSEDKNEKYIISVPKFTTTNENKSDSILKLVDLSNKMSRVFDVNGTLFVESERISQHDNDELKEYELYQIDKTEDNDDEDMITTLDMHIQTLPQGVIINSNVFLWDAQWHTMALVDDQLFRCAMCQVYCDRLTCEDHVETIAHLRNLDKYRPLMRFDLSIVRKINENLHCGVCNEMFDIMDHEIHENSKKHEENLLTAINKVSDLMYDSNIHLDRKGNFYSSNRNTINPERLTSSSDRITSSSDRLTSTSDGLTSSSDRITSSPARLTSSYDRITASYDRITPSSDRNASTQDRLRNNGEYHFDANAINNNNNHVYEEFNEEEFNEEEFSEEEENQFEEADEATEEYSYEIEEYNTPSQGVSYASMASKPTIELPKFLKIDLGTKEVRVKFESWHMIVKIESNMFYCMVCNKKDHIRFKSQHCISCEHVEKLAQCTVVRAFEDYLIRKVDDKLYHCGHCNNLQYHNQMEDHIESLHPKINRNFVEKSNPVKSTKKTKTIDKTNSKTVIEPKKTESDKSAIINKNMEYIEPNMELPKFDIFGDIPLSPFGSGLKIPALNFNLIVKRDDEYYCVICEKVVADVKAHVEEMDHIELMTMTPFIKPFQNHLTRAVRGMLHCSLCNKLFPVAKVYDHNIDPPHTSALATAMGMKKTQKPVKTKKANAVPTVNMRHFSFTHDDKTTISNSQIQKDIVPVPLNQSTGHVGAQETNNAPETGKNIQLLNLGQNAAPQNVFNAENRLYTHGQSCQNEEQSLMTLLKIGQNLPNCGQNLPHPGQILPNSGQNLLQPGQNLPKPGQNLANPGQHLPQPGQILPNSRQNLRQPGQYLPNSGQNLLQPGQYLPNSGQNVLQPGQNLPKSGQNLTNSGPNLLQPGQNVHYLGQNLPKSGQNLTNSGQIFSFPQNLNAQAIKSIPPMFNSMFPLLPSVNSQILQNQFVGAPLMYNMNSPQRSLSPFPNLTPNNSPNRLSPNIPVNTNQNQTEKNNNQDTERKPIIITDRNDKSNSSIDKIRRDSDNSRPGSGNIKQDSNNSRPGSNNIRRDSVNSKSGSDNSRPGSNITRDSDNSKSGNYNVELSDNIETESLSEGDEQKEFDEEEMVFLKLKTTYFKITNMSYNSLVFLDNGIRYCFVCSSIVLTTQQQKHVDSRKHMECLADNKFLDKYGVQLFRQMYLMYHCAICNELMTRKEIKLHLDWPIHEENYNTAHLILNKKNRKQLKSGLKEYLLETQKEAIFHNVNEPHYHVRAAYQIVPNLDVKKDALESRPAKGSKSAVVKKNKMVIQNNVVMKISFDHWHGIATSKNITKCVICQLEITTDEVLEHVETDYHAVALGKTFEKTYYPALVRKINEHTVNCMTCNLEVPNNEYMILEHVNGRKHSKNQENIVNETSNSDSYADCYEDYLNL